MGKWISLFHRSSFWFAVAAAAALFLVISELLPRWDGGEGGFARTVLPESATVFAEALSPRGRLAIVIDDFGQGRDGARQMLALDCPLTFAVLPHGTFTQQDAEDGYNRGAEIIVHIPMEPVRGEASWLGEAPILCNQQNAEISYNTALALNAVPHAVGANIHMGSRASADDRVMRCVLGEIKAQGLFFLDSRTAADSVVPQVAQELGVPVLTRNVFLDGRNQSKAEIVEQLRFAGKFALEHGAAVAIGHVGIEGGKRTAQAIAELLPQFADDGVELVTLSQLLPDDTP